MRDTSQRARTRRPPPATIGTHDTCAHRRRRALARAPRRIRRSERPRVACLPHRRHQRVPGTRRRHGGEPVADRALRRRGSARQSRARALGDRSRRRARRTARSPRQLGDHPLAARARALRPPGEGGVLDGHAIADALRRASTEADAALREPVEGTILTVARALADGAEARPRATSSQPSRLRSRLPRRRSRARPSCCPRYMRPASSMPEGPGSSSSSAARSPRCAGIPSPRSPRSSRPCTSRSPPTTTGRATAPAS